MSETAIQLRGGTRYVNFGRNPSLTVLQSKGDSTGELGLLA
jgi:hypothetical protein